jgi:ribosomal protein L11 methyltransferase
MTPAEAYLEARVAVAQAQVAAVEALMEGQGALAVTLTDVADVPVLEPGVGETPLWPEVEVCGLFAADTQPQSLQAALSLAPGVETAARVRIAALAEQDWVRTWQAGLEPMRFGDDLWIVPSHLQAPDAGATVVRLDPGLAFGSGTHPSTRLCLEWIDGHDLKGRTVLDFGCGSGVLGIAAACKGAREVFCVDNDPQALVATRDNAGRNGVAERLRVMPPEALGPVRAEVVLANILSGTLIDLARELAGAVAPMGTLVLAGILTGQAEAVAAAFSERFPGMRETRLDEWASLVGKAQW